MKASRDLAAYAMVAGCFVLVGLTGSLVSWASAPGSVLLVLRFSIAAVVLLAVFARRRPLKGVFRRDMWLKLLLMGLLDGGSLLAYFFAIRSVGVAVATFLLFTQPVWVALLAPRIVKTPTERIVFASLGVALVGLGVILAPSLLGGGVHLPAIGLAVGLAAGLCYAGFQLLVKGLTREFTSVTIVIVECTLDALVILPLAVWQLAGTGMSLTSRDLVAAVVLGLLCTAVAYTMWVEGVARLRVQHSAILGFLTPVVAPLFAWLLLGEAITVATALGGVLIVAAGVLVVVFGRGEVEGELPLEPRAHRAATCSATPSWWSRTSAWPAAPRSSPGPTRPRRSSSACGWRSRRWRWGRVFLRRPMLADWRRPGAAWRLALMAAMSSLTLLLFFYAVRNTSVAIAMFMLFLMPVWVALAAPRLFKSPREPIVWPALGLALAGLAVILVPDLLGEGVEVSLLGMLAALFTGFGYATYTISVKGLTKIVAPSTISMAEAAGDTLLVLPLAVWQFSSTGYHLDGKAWIAAVVMGVFCTAIPYTLWIVGTKRVRVEHVTILGYIEPVAGPLYAVFLVGQLPTVWTVIGGALILGAGLLIVVFGRGEGDGSVAAAAEPEPL